MAPKDTRTRYQGVFARHQRSCAVNSGGSCDCAPSYFGSAWDRSVNRHRKTKHFHLPTEARNARSDLIAALQAGKPEPGRSIRLDDARDRFIDAARDGVALNKWGRRYRPRAVDDLDSALHRVSERLARRRLNDIRRGDVQQAVDELVAEGLSGSRVRSVVNALRSLYRWAQDRELAERDPAALIRLPAMGARPRDRVATPAEFTKLLAVLDLEDALPWAIAGYATARHQEIQVLDWRHVSFDLDALELAADEEGRKPGGSWRVVPMVSPLKAMLRRAWIAQRRPKRGRVCPPRRRSLSGRVSLAGVQERVRRRWRELGMNPIGLHEARHTAATWLDHAGVSPKVASQLMGHKTPEYQPGAAAITLSRYTHTLPGELERARELLDKFLVERAREEAKLR